MTNHPAPQQSRLGQRAEAMQTLAQLLLARFRRLGMDAHVGSASIEQTADGITVSNDGKVAATLYVDRSSQFRCDGTDEGISTAESTLLFMSHVLAAIEFDKKLDGSIKRLKAVTKALME